MLLEPTNSVYHGAKRVQTVIATTGGHYSPSGEVQNKTKERQPSGLDGIYIIPAAHSGIQHSSLEGTQRQEPVLCFKILVSSFSCSQKEVYLVFWLFWSQWKWGGEESLILQWPIRKSLQRWRRDGHNKERTNSPINRDHGYTQKRRRPLQNSRPRGRGPLHRWRQSKRFSQGTDGTAQHQLDNVYT